MKLYVPLLGSPHRPSPTVRLYKTGDRVRLLAGGDIEYLGRIDQQVKIRGFRIELGEIEALLAQHAAVAEAAVIVREDTPGDKRLVAYIVPVQKPETANQEPGETAADGSRFAVRDPLGGAQLRRHLASRLPDYMLPAAFVALERLPLTTNGKLDRRALPAPDPARSMRSSSFVAAQTETERLLADVWAAVLGIEQVGIHDNFFELGGDSMRAIQALAKANQYGLALSLPQLFEQQTIHALAHLCHPGQPAVHAAQTAAFSLISEADRQKLPDDVEDAYPLSVLQAGMIYHTEYEPGTDVYHDLMGSRIHLPLALVSLRDALQEVIRRHPVLRTSVALAGFSEPLQLVHRDIAVPLTVEDLQHLSHAEQEQAIDAWFAIEKRRAFDWHTPPLFCVHVHQRGPACFNLTLSFHHIILEGWSIATLLTELFQLYLAALGRETRPLAPPPASLFRDFVAIERRVVQSEAARHYWVQKFTDTPLTRLPRWPQSSRAGGQPGVLEISVSPAVSDHLKQLAQIAGVPFKSVLLAAHLRMLRLHCNQAGVTTGLVTNIRPEVPDADRVLGLSLNTLPFSLALPGGSWIDLVRATFKAEQADIAFRAYPLAEIQRHLGRPLFETVFNIVHFHVYQALLEQEGLDSINEKVFQRTNFPLLTSFVLDPRSAQLERLVIDYDGREICLEQVRAVGDSYLDILEAMATHPEARYEAQTLLPASMRPIVEGNRNHAAIAGSEERCIHTLFEAQVARTPDTIALAFHSLRCASSVDTHLTYRELNCRANQLAHHLKQLGVGPETLVGLCVERSSDMVVGLLGILKAGGAYVPFDPSYPQARLAFMLQDVQIKVLVTQASLIERLPEYNGALVCLDTARNMIARLPQENPDNSVEATNLAYVLYTSGSTGRPKGVAIEHRQTTNLLYWARDTFRPEELRGVLAATSLNFDLSVFEIFAPLSWGGKVIVAENILHLPYLADREEMTLLNTVPSAMTELVLDRLPASVRVVTLAGEPLRDALVQQIYAQETVDKVFNLYGPTEATTYATCALMQKGHNDPITIGRPIRATEVYILDDHLQPVPIGVPGQLYLGGAGLARGYVQRPELTDEKFIAHPFRAEPGARLYKTGDLTRYLPDGQIEYLGRMDHQIKMRGFRIEPGEIEAVLLQHPAIRNAVVIAREDTPGGKYLAAYLVTDEVQQVTIGELRHTLHLHLPDYMVPAYYMMLDTLPFNAHGKVDRQALPGPDRTQSVVKTAYVAPRTPSEHQLASLWTALLGIEEIGIHDNFFALGGHSILGLAMIAWACDHGLELTIKQLFQTPTIAALAQAGR